MIFEILAVCGTGLGITCVILLVKIFYHIPTEIDLDMSDLARKLGNIEGGLKSSNVRQIKQLDSLLGQDLIDQYPILQVAQDRLPRAAKYVEKFPHLVPILGKRIQEGIDSISGDKLPPWAQELVNAFLKQQVQRETEL